METKTVDQDGGRDDRGEEATDHPGSSSSPTISHSSLTYYGIISSEFMALFSTLLDEGKEN